MPRFYFDSREGERFVPDEEGLEFPDQATAECEAAKAATSIGCDLLPSGRVGKVTIEIRDEDGQPLVAVTVSLTITRYGPAVR